MNRNSLSAVLFVTLSACRPELGSSDRLDSGQALDPARNLPATINPKVECGISVSTERELMITDLSVVEDSERTVWNGDPDDAISGAWDFGRLMTAMAGDEDPSEFVESWLESWTADFVLNDQTVAERPGMSTILADWPRIDDGSLDLTASPMRLLAIVNRVDLAKTGSAGEGRFIFGVTQAGNATDATIILEYTLPPEVQSLDDWAAAWHNLGSLTLGTAEYNAALQEVTDAFASRGTRPRRVNGSAISQVRTNEKAWGDGGPWELREYRLGSDGFLAAALPALTPVASLDDTTTLRSYVNQNATRILDGTYRFFPTYRGEAFAAAAVTHKGGLWNIPTPVDPEVRHTFALNTCDGCHGDETNTNFVHVTTREAGVESSSAGFLTGIDVTDPVDGVTVRTFSDLERRADNMTALLCP